MLLLRGTVGEGGEGCQRVGDVEPVPPRADRKAMHHEGSRRKELGRAFGFLCPPQREHPRDPCQEQQPGRRQRHGSRHRRSGCDHMRSRRWHGNACDNDRCSTTLEKAGSCQNIVSVYAPVGKSRACQAEARLREWGRLVCCDNVLCNQTSKAVKIELDLGRGKDQAVETELRKICGVNKCRAASEQIGRCQDDIDRRSGLDRRDEFVYAGSAICRDRAGHLLPTKCPVHIIGDGMGGVC